MEYDEYARLSEDKYYTVRSIYFDDKNLRYFYQKEYNHADRKKIRLRGYGSNPEGKVVMEIKRKFSGAGIKNRGFVKFQDAIQTIRGAKLSQPIIDNQDVKMFMYHIVRHRLFPTVNVIYDREAFMLGYKNDNNLRVTFDMNLRFNELPKIDSLFSNDGVQDASGTNFIMEVKYNDVCPNWLIDILSSFGLKKSPASKYSISVAKSRMMRTGLVNSVKHFPVEDY